MQSEICAGRFDQRVDLPVRVGVVTCGQEVHRLGWSLCHMATDAWSNAIIHDELVALLTAAAPERAGLAAPARQPREQASIEQSTADRAWARTARYWHDVLRECPPSDLLRPRYAEASPRFWHGLLESEKLAVAARIVATRYRVSESSVFLAAVSRSLAEYAGSDRVPLWLRAANRHDHAVRGSVMYLCQNVPVVIDAGDQPFETLVREAHVAAVSAYRHSRYDPEQARALLDEVNWQRASPVGFSGTFNFHPGFLPPATSLRHTRPLPRH